MFGNNRGKINLNNNILFHSIDFFYVSSQRKCKNQFVIKRKVSNVVAVLSLISSTFYFSFFPCTLYFVCGDSPNIICEPKRFENFERKKSFHKKTQLLRRA